MLMRDIYCSANILLKQHGPAAKSYAIQRVQELRASGDEKGAWVWMASSTRPRCWNRVNHQRGKQPINQRPRAITTSREKPMGTAG